MTKRVTVSLPVDVAAYLEGEENASAAVADALRARMDRAAATAAMLRAVGTDVTGERRTRPTLPPLTAEQRAENKAAARNAPSRQLAHRRRRPLMPQQDIEIHAVLDSSAMMSFARGHVHVGELLIQIADEHAYTGLPTVALLDAYAQIGADPTARERLGVLATLPGVKVLPLGPAEASEVAATVRLVKGDLARAHAVWAALKHGGYYLTCEPRQTPSPLDPELIHYIPIDEA